MYAYSLLLIFFRHRRPPPPREPPPLLALPPLGNCRWHRSPLAPPPPLCVDCAEDMLWRLACPRLLSFFAVLPLSMPPKALCFPPLSIVEGLCLPPRSAVPAALACPPRIHCSLSSAGTLQVVLKRLLPPARSYRDRPPGTSQLRSRFPGCTSAQSPDPCKRLHPGGSASCCHWPWPA